MADTRRAPVGNPTAAYPADNKGVRLVVEEAAERPDPHSDAPPPRRPMGPASWWRIGLVVFAALILALAFTQPWQRAPAPDAQDSAPAPIGAAPQVPPPTLPTT